ncbi:MAG: DUF1330 domain-containing protein [Shimia sp.]|jgi:uncharacterized protein (DUF1330 family)|uniref:DUF1330 domain-containing protein n=1 Tax=Shimia sp. TaxID=1954381 RepID=UPI004057EEF6
MAYYSILAVTPTSEDWIPDYIGPANARVAHHGGKYIARTTNHEQVEGPDSPAALRILIEWPSRQAALDFMADDEYAPYLKARTAGSNSYHWLLEGKDDLA